MTQEGVFSSPAAEFESLYAPHYRANGDSSGLFAVERFFVLPFSLACTLYLYDLEFLKFRSYEEDCNISSCGCLERICCG